MWTPKLKGRAILARRMLNLLKNYATRAALDGFEMNRASERGFRSLVRPVDSDLRVCRSGSSSIGGRLAIRLGRSPCKGGKVLSCSRMSNKPRLLLTKTKI